MPNEMTPGDAIKRLEACKAFYGTANVLYGGLEYAISTLRKVSAGELVPVVHCKDCRFYETIGACGCPDAHSIEFPTRESDDFCSYGRGKDDR